MAHKNRKKGNKFNFTGCSLLTAEGCSCSLDVLYGGQGISKLQFLINKRKTNISAVIFFLKVLVIKTLDPDWIRIRICVRIHLKCWIRIWIQ